MARLTKAVSLVNLRLFFFATLDVVNSACACVQLSRPTSNEHVPCVFSLFGYAQTVTGASDGVLPDSFGIVMIWNIANQF